MIQAANKFHNITQNLRQFAERSSENEIDKHE